jgi:hypothetical protein
VLARTVDEADTVLPSRRETRPHTVGPQQPQMRYKKIGKALGSGQFGNVYKAVDADTGRLMAVKVLKRPTGTSERMTLFNALKREVETLSRLSHVSATDFPPTLAFVANTSTSHTLWTTLRPKVGTDQRWRYSWGSNKGP